MESTEQLQRTENFQFKGDIITKTTNKMQLCRLLYYSLSALHVSADVFAHNQEHLTVFTASGSIHQCRCLLVS